MIEWSNHAHALVPNPKLCEFRLPGRPRRTKEGVLKVRTQRVVEGKADLPRRLPDATIDCCWSVRIFFDPSLQATLGSDHPRTRLGCEGVTILELD